MPTRRDAAFATMRGVHRIPPRPADTSVDAERVQIELLRAAPLSRRLHLACSLSASAISAARRAVARADPSADATERDIQFVALHYGSAVAAALRADLMRRATDATMPR